jgi:hypothetical protein
MSLLEAGSRFPPCSLRASHLFSSSGVFCALSGAGLIPRLPLLRLELFLICAIYVVRGFDLIPDFFHRINGLNIEWEFTVFSVISLLSAYYICRE